VIDRHRQLLVVREGRPVPGEQGVALRFDTQRRIRALPRADRAGVGHPGASPCDRQQGTPGFCDPDRVSEREASWHARVGAGVLCGGMRRGGEYKADGKSRRQSSHGETPRRGYVRETAELTNCGVYAVR